jgi:multidrug resistance protein
VTFGAFIDLVAYSIAVPVLPDYTRELGASPTVIGFLFSSFGLTLLIASVPMGAISDRVGRRGPLVLGLAALAISTLVFAFARQLSWLFAARLIQGAADAVTWVVGFALLADLYAPAERGRVMGFVMSGATFGLMVGPSLGGWLYEAGGIALPFLIVAAGAAAATIAALLMPFPPGQAARETVPLRMIAGVPGVAVCAVAVILGSATLSMMEPVVSLWLTDRLALNPGRIGLVFGIAAVASTALHPVYGSLADRWGGRRLTLVGLTAMSMMLPVVAQAWDFSSAVGLYVLLAAGAAMVVTPSLAYMGDAVSAAGVSSFGVAYGLYNFAWGAGLLIGPALGGFLYERLGFSGLTVVWAPSVVAVTSILVLASRENEKRRT